MLCPVKKPRIVVAGLSLALYDRALEGYMARLSEQLAAFQDKVKPFADIEYSRLCFEESHFAETVRLAERKKVDALLLIPQSYTTSMMVAGALLRTTLPVVIWNTQMAVEIERDFDFDALLMNHVPQGTQDITNVLIKKGRVFGMESGHCSDALSLQRLAAWLEAAKTVNFCRGMRVGILGKPFVGMGDFDFDTTRLKEDWGPQTVTLELSAFVEKLRQVKPADVDEKLRDDKKNFKLDAALTESAHRMSLSHEIALRELLAEANVDAFTMNFLDLIDFGVLKTLPFLGINKLMAAGLGYAGEGDIMTAAHVAQLRQLCGTANFTEIYTIDYRQNRMLMTHMQECNPAMARRDRKISLRQKDFWAPGIEPYTGMHFTLEPGPVTLSAVSFDQDGRFYYLAYEAKIYDMEPLAKFDIPHWLVQLDEPAGDFLNRYSIAGGGHHLAAALGHQAAALEKLARLQNFGFKNISPGK